MTDVVERAFESIQRVRLEDFFRRELPADVIASVELLVDVFANSDQAERERIVQRVERPFAFVFPSYAQRAAEESVRRNDPELVKRGLIGLAIENASVDFRDTLPFLAFLYNSALRLNLNALELFRSVAQYSCPNFRRVLEGFSDVSEKSRSIETYHYKEAGVGSSFRYVYVEPTSHHPSKTVWKIRRFILRLRRLMRS